MAKDPRAEETASPLPHWTTWVEAVMRFGDARRQNPESTTAAGHMTGVTTVEGGPDRSVHWRLVLLSTRVSGAEIWST